MFLNSSLILNSLKHLANLPDELLLLAPSVLEPITALKNNLSNDTNYLLTLEDVLIALSVCGATSDFANKALSHLGSLKGCEAHASSMITSGEEQFIKSLGIHLTCEPEFPNSELYFA